MTITAHYFNKKFELKHTVLDFIRVSGSHTGKNLGTEFVNSLKTWGLLDRVSR